MTVALMVSERIRWKMIKRTPKEIKAYADGFNDCYKNFTKYLKKGQEYALEEMELIRTAVNNVAKIEGEENG